jgi:hypothetical protein
VACGEGWNLLNVRVAPGIFDNVVGVMDFSQGISSAQLPRLSNPELQRELPLLCLDKTSQLQVDPTFLYRVQADIE